MTLISIDIEDPLPLDGQRPKASTLGICTVPAQTWHSVDTPCSFAEWRRLGFNLSPFLLEGLSALICEKDGKLVTMAETCVH